MISQRTIDQVRERVLLTELLAGEPGFKRSGSGYSCRCPFHDEKTPSFHIREDGRSYHCFGCGVSGNIFSYVMEKRGLSFPDAVEFLASSASIPIEYEKRNDNRAFHEEKRDLVESQIVAQEYFHTELKKALRTAKHEPEKSDEARALRDYLVKRKISRDAVVAFGVGFAPPGWDGLTSVLKEQKVPLDRMVKSGLARRNPKGEAYDTFRGRLMFPIIGDRNQPIAFGGRTIPGISRDDEPKYLNSPETAIYKKSSTLYGLPQALEEARKTREVYLVEGYMDVIGLWQVGVRRSVACCGTALGTEHLHRLERLVNRVFLLFDGDDAGVRAAARCFAVSLNSPLQVEAVFLPPGEDPDTIALREGEHTGTYLQSLPRKQLLDLFIESLLQKYSVRHPSELGPQLKDRVCDEAAAQIQRCEKSIARDELYRRAGFLLLVDPGLLKSRGAHTAQANRPVVREEPPPRMRVGLGELPRRDREVLYAVFALPQELGTEVLADPNLQAALHPVTLTLVQEMVELTGSSEGDDAVIRELVEEQGPGWADHWERAKSMLGDQAVDLRKMLKECRQSVQREQVQRTLKQLEKLIATTTDEENRKSLIQQQVALARVLQQRG